MLGDDEIYAKAFFNKILPIYMQRVRSMFGKDIDKVQLIHTILRNKRNRLYLTNNHLFDSQPTFATQKKTFFC